MYYWLLIVPQRFWVYQSYMCILVDYSRPIYWMHNYNTIGFGFGWHSVAVIIFCLFTVVQTTSEYFYLLFYSNGLSKNLIILHLDQLLWIHLYHCEFFEPADCSVRGFDLVVDIADETMYIELRSNVVHRLNFSTLVHPCIWYAQQPWIPLLSISILLHSFVAIFRRFVLL